MKKIIASEESPTVLSFEDDILECFFMDGSTRLHIIHIKGIELSTDNKGKHLLTVQLKYKNLFIFVDEGPLVEVQEMVEKIKQALKKGK
jgi:hypothetical protein